MFRNSLVLLPVLLFAGLGFYSTLNSWDGVVYYKDGNHSPRIPATLAKEINNSQLKSVNYTSLFKNERILSTSVQRVSGNIEISISNFAVKDKSQKLRSICSLFQDIQLNIQAKNTSVNGEPTLITAKGLCRESEDGKSLAKIVIPITELKSKKPSSIKKFEFAAFTLSTQNTDFNWPSKWLLKSLIFENPSQDQNNLSINLIEKNHLIEFEFK